MFEVDFRIAALVESDRQGQQIFHITEKEEPANETQFSSLLATIYQQEVYKMLRPGDSLTIMLRCTLPPRESERSVHMRDDRLFEGDSVPQPTPDLLALMRAWYEPWMRQVSPGDIFTISFRVERV